MNENENTPRALSIEEAVSALRQSREDQAKADQPQEEAKAEPEEVLEDQSEGNAEEESETEAEDAEPNEESEDESEDDDGDLYEVGGEQFTLSELREWKANGLRQADYTRKTQEISDARKGFEAERSQWDSEREAVVEQIRQQQTHLKEALATFAVEQDPEPKPDGLTWEEFTKRKSAWDKRQSQKVYARNAFQALQEEQHRELVQRETASLMRHFPEWRDQTVFESDAKAMIGIAAQYGFTEAEMANITDHRMFRVLSELKSLRAASEQRKANEVSAAKKVVTAAKRLAPGAKIDGKNQASKELRHSLDQLRKTGSIQDAVAALHARRRAT